MESFRNAFDLRKEIYVILFTNGKHKTEMAQELKQLTKDYNERSIKVFRDLYKLTQNENFNRYVSIIEHDMESGNDYDILWKHLQNMSDEYTERVLQGDRSFFESSNFDDERVEKGLMNDIRQSWSMISPRNQEIVFVKLQNIFRIAEFIRNNHFETLIRVHSI